MIDNNSKNNTLDDRQLSQLMKEKLPAAPANPWFTRKVMNRLPAKDPHIYSWIEYTTYAIALVALIVFWCIFYNDIKESGKLTIDDIKTYVVMAALSVVLCIGFVAPKVRQWLAEP